MRCCCPLRALDLKPGDEVIAPAFTFFATAGAIHNAGGTPVFVDIDAATFNVTPEAIEAAITPRTRAIVVVHLFGQMAPMERIVPIARKHGLAIIEDGAQSIGARRQIDGAWRVAGELGTVGTLSFFPSKNLGAWGDGGMMLTQDDALGSRLAKLRLHGGARQYHHEEVGFNSRLDSLQAAVLLVKLRHLQAWNEARRARAAWYDKALGATRRGSRRRPSTRPTSTSITSTPSGPSGATSCWRTSRRRASAARSTIRCRCTCSPASPTWAIGRGSLPVTERAMAEVLSLPIYPELTEAQQGLVVDTIRRFYA